MTDNSTSSKEVLEMNFDPKTIEHLGIHQYSTLPPVIAELVANSYDADATEVKINLIDSDQKKEIIITDNGHGMGFNDINHKFLRIGRNRREEENSQTTESGDRLVIGKKGIGKLSFFGISRQIILETTRDGVLNKFEMNWDRLKEVGAKKQPYRPNIIIKNEKTTRESGTTIQLNQIQRKSEFDPEGLAESLSRYFFVFDEPDFNVQIIHNGDQNNAIEITNELKYKKLNFEYTLDFPLKNEEEYEYKDEINGKFIAAEETVPNSLEGIALYSRGKLVNEHNFYDVKASSHGYKYITGWLNVDFIDDWNKEVISTNRKSLNWEDEDTQELKNYLNKTIRSFYNDHRKWKEKKKKEEVEEESGIDLDEWIENIPSHERKLAKKLVNAIIKDEGIEVKKAGTMVGFVRDSFQFKSFKELAADLDETDLLNETKILDLFREWQFIETRELYKIAQVRIEAIKKFEQHIDQNSREVPEIHNFFVKFPWILDPRIMDFEDEKTFSNLLKENFKELDKDKKNRRLDFLCVNFSESFFIIELKRPKSVIGENELMQAIDYVSFIRERLGNEYGTNIYCYVIGERLAKTDRVKQLAKSLRNDKAVYIKPYNELLSNAKKYHQEFIQRYEELDIT